MWLGDRSVETRRPRVDIDYSAVDNDGDDDGDDRCRRMLMTVKEVCSGSARDAVMVS